MINHIMVSKAEPTEREQKPTVLIQPPELATTQLIFSMLFEALVLTKAKKNRTRFNFFHLDLNAWHSKSCGNA